MPASFSTGGVGSVQATNCEAELVACAKIDLQGPLSMQLTVKAQLVALIRRTGRCLATLMALKSLECKLTPPPKAWGMCS